MLVVIIFLILLFVALCDNRLLIEQHEKRLKALERRAAKENPS